MVLSDLTTAKVLALRLLTDDMVALVPAARVMPHNLLAQAVGGLFGDRAGNADGLTVRYGLRVVGVELAP